MRVQKAAADAYASVGEDDVDTAHHVVRTVGETDDVFMVGNIAVRGDRARTCRGRHDARPLIVYVSNQDPTAPPRKLMNDGASDAGSPTRDDGP